MNSGFVGVEVSFVVLSSPPQPKIGPASATTAALATSSLVQVAS